MNLIRKVRQEKRMSQEKLASLVGVATQTIHRWESGKRSPRADELSRLASALNTTVAYLTGETDAPERPASSSEIPNSSPGPEAVKVETQTQTRDRGELYYRFADGSELRLPDTPENKPLFEKLITQGLSAGKGE